MSNNNNNDNNNNNIFSLQGYLQLSKDGREENDIERAIRSTCDRLV